MLANSKCLIERVSVWVGVVAATHWSGPSEYMTTENSYPLRHDSMEPIPEGAFKVGAAVVEPARPVQPACNPLLHVRSSARSPAPQGHLMAEPSVEHLQELLQRVWDRPEEAKARGDAARRDMVQRFHPQRLAQFLSAQFGRIATHVERRRGAITGGRGHGGEL